MVDGDLKMGWVVWEGKCVVCLYVVLWMFVEFLELFDGVVFMIIL